jgi:large subunit ribosomal protein L18
MKNVKIAKRERRHVKIRTRVAGTAEKPRLSVFKSNLYIYAQLINDDASVTIAAASSAKEKGAKAIAATKVGEVLAKAALAKGVKKVVFDRGGFKYTGRVKALADGARKGGLEF